MSFVCLFALVSNASGEVLFSDDFETDYGNWPNVTGDTHDWTRDSDGTPSSNTGPSSGANGSTWYVYLECSESGGGAYTSGDNAILEGPNLDADAYDLELSFYYHMYGGEIGTLNVDVYDGTWNDGVWNLSGPQGDVYTQAIVDLSAYTGTIKLRFRAVAAGGWAGDIAIDDIEISGTNAVPQVTVPNVVGLDQASAEASILSASLTVGSITQSFSNTTPLGDVISQTPAAGTEQDQWSAVNLNVSKGTAVTDFEDLLVFAANWLDTDCGPCNDQDYSGDNDVDLEDYAFFAQEWLLQPPATLVINEFMASNDTTIADGFGEYDDWIEIYNYGTEQINMEGMKLVDDTPSSIYTIPAGVTIAAGEYKLFWADGDAEEGQGATHVGFKLGASGDEITLYDTDGVSLIDSITYRADQVTDISHGRFPDNTPNWYNMDDPTPGATNTAGMAGDVWFSKVSGTFTSSFNLELFTETPGATIRYTTDGSMPTAGSTAYSGPISIGTGGSSRIRAQAYHATLAPSPVQSHYYIPIASDIQGFESNLPVVIIDSFGENIDNNGTIGCWNPDGPEYPYQPVASVFFDLDKDTGLASTADVPDFAGRAGSRIRGESSRCWEKRQYAFELWDDNDLDEKHSLLGMPSESDWILNAPYGDKTLMRNVLAYKWGNDIMTGFAAPGTKFVEVFYNQDGGNCSYADYRGVYVLIEKIKVSKNRLDIGSLDPADNDINSPDITGGYILRVDKNHGEETFGTSYIGAVQYYDPDEFTLTGTQKTWIQNHISEFEGVLSPLNTDPVTGYPKYIDVENFQETDAILELFKNVDGFKLSMYFYKERNGKISFGPMWDYNFGSGNARDPGYPDHWWWFPDWFPYASNTDEGWFNDGFAVYGWHDRLMQDFEYKLGTADKWFEHREDKLSDAQIIADIDSNYAYLTTNVPFAGGADNAADRNFTRYNILNSYIECNYYYGNNTWFAEQANIPHTYYMEKEWLKNWFTGQGIPTAPETYISNLSDRTGVIDAFWESDRNIAAPPTLLVNSTPMDTGGSITAGATLTMTAATPGTIYYTIDGTDPRQAVTGNAVGTAYSSGIILNETKQVKARIKDGSNWSALNEAVFSDDRLASSLRITEVMYHPVDPNDEYIEFKNIGPATINLAHCQLTKGVDFTFPSVTLAPNAYTVVARNQTHFEATYSPYSGSIAGEYTLVDKLDNGGENIRLKDAAGVIIQEFDYEDGWFPITDGSGYSLNLMTLDPTDPNDWNKRLSWEASNVAGGTPGEAHVANAVANDVIVINEVLTHTDLGDGDWIELYNTTGAPISVDNWYLSDDKDNLKKYMIPAMTPDIPAYGYAVFTSAAHFGGLFGLSEHGEDIFLTSGNGTDIAGGYSDGESFGSAKSEVTFGRYTKSDGNVDFVEMTSVTQGSANPTPAYVPNVVISEIMYNAEGIQDLLGEYIELHNRTGSTVYLYDTSNPSNTWKFTKGIDFTFPTGVSIGAGQKILISRTHPDAFKAANGLTGVTVYGPFASGTELENDGEKIELSMPTDPDPGTGFFSYIRVEQVNYSDGIHPLGNDPWPTDADGRGDALHRTTLSDYANDVANWSAATPSPGS